MNLKSAIAFAAACSAMGAACAQAAKDKASERPLLVIGASHAEGKTPFNNGHRHRRAASQWGSAHSSAWATR
jgi:hypothetical protein